jgi:hypothetical protein
MFGAFSTRAINQAPLVAPPPAPRFLGFVFRGSSSRWRSTSRPTSQTWSAFTHNSFKFTDAWELVFGRAVLPPREGRRLQPARRLARAPTPGQPHEISGFPTSKVGRGTVGRRRSSFCGHQQGT